MRDLKSLDLNLLKALDALLDERNVTRAAERLDVTQPAMSGMLTRLRFTLSLAATDYAQSAIAVPFLGELRRQAPGIRVACCRCRTIPCTSSSSVATSISR